MPEKPETSPIQTYAQAVLRQYREAAIQIRASMLVPEQKIPIITEGYKIYDTAVRAVYDIVCLLDIDGDEINPNQVRALRDGLEEFLSKRKTK